MKLIGVILFLTGLAFMPSPVRTQSITTGLRDGDDLDARIRAISNPLYNLRFDETKAKIDELQKVLPAHPVVDVLYAINITWKALPEPLPDDFDEIRTHLNSSLKKADAWLKEDPKNPEAIFFLLVSHGLLAQQYNQQGSPLKAVSEAKKAYRSIIHSFRLKEDYREFVFSCGLYNYYRKRYPELYPAYKPLMWLFKKGNAVKGLEQLDSARKVTVLSRVESAHYLAYIYLRYEQEPTKAIKILDSLVLEFPGNLHFRSLLLESYMALGELDRVSDMINPLMSADLTYFRLCGTTFNGVLCEKYEGDDVAAKNYYSNAVKMSSSFETKNINALGTAYAGLARISARRNDVDKAKEYYELSAKCTRTETIKQEAKTFLKEHKYD